jgi:hypothetical protein
MIEWIKHLPEELSAESVSGARQAAEQGEDPESWLLSRKLVTEKDILKAKSVYFRLPYITLSGYHPSQEAIELVSEEQARDPTVLSG